MKLIYFTFVFALSFTYLQAEDAVNYGPTERAALIDRIEQAKKVGVKIGMTKLQCTLAWGEPRKINRSKTAAGTTEQWVYYDDRYLYFDGNVLTEIQD